MIPTLADTLLEMPLESPTPHAASPEAAPLPDLPPEVRRLVLTGFMGAGKSTVGHLLAEGLGWRFLDLDDHIEQRAGATVPQLFERHGEAGFRRLESTALASALRLSETVIALGGGTPEMLTNRLLLEQTPGTRMIFLEADLPTLLDRCSRQGTGRPVLAQPELAQTRFHERQPFYRRLAQHTIDTSHISPAEAAHAVLIAVCG